MGITLALLSALCFGLSDFAAGLAARKVHSAVVVSGVLATSAIAAYLLSTRTESLSISVVLTSLYPAVPVVLGLTFLHERLSRRQVLGLACAVATILLVSL